MKNNQLTTRNNNKIVKSSCKINKPSQIIDVDFTETCAKKFSPRVKIFWAASFLLFLTCVHIPILSIIHDLGSIIFIVWLACFIFMLDEASSDNFVER